jgi:hypothetical protein
MLKIKKKGTNPSISLPSVGSWFAKQARKDVMEANNGFLVTPVGYPYAPKNTDTENMDQKKYPRH